MTVCDQCSGCGIELGTVAAVDDDARTGLRQAARDGQPQAGATAGDNGKASGEIKWVIGHG